MSIAIKPVRFAENGFMTRPFALGGEGAEGLDPAVKYRSCLQNWVVDTGSEVILVDTGLAAAREALDRVRAFCAARPTVYLGTHTPEALESLAAHRVVDLANPPVVIPPAVIPPGEIVFKTATGKYVCSVCGYVYDPAEHGGVAFENLPADWRCPRCKQSKDKFNPA